MLKKIFDVLFYSCRHDWIISRSINKANRRYYPDNLPPDTILVLQCKKCGDIKTKTI